MDILKVKPQDNPVKKQILLKIVSDTNFEQCIGIVTDTFFQSIVMVTVTYLIFRIT